jgi:hypothetical protein
MSSLPYKNNEYYDFDDFIYVVRGDGQRSKRYHHWCLKCYKDRGFAYKNKILKEQFCHKCKMKLEEVKALIGQLSSLRVHTDKTRSKISATLYSKYGTNPTISKIKRNLRSRLNKAIHGKYKTGSAVEDLGCSIIEFISHIELKFSPQMTWANYGEWQIDHIVPLCQFNLQNELELKKACHYTNLQPLWSADNLKKRHTDGTFKK